MSAAHPTTNGKPGKTCDQCGVVFYGNGNAKRCGPECKAIARLKWNRGGFDKPFAKRHLKRCTICGLEYRAVFITGKYCSKACNRRNRLAKLRDLNAIPETACVECGARFVPSRATNHHCSKQCRWRFNMRNRRARKRDLFVEPVPLVALLKRDNDTCQICGTKVAIGSKVPELYAPTVDHVIPQSKGGEHSMANCQLAHFVCNVIKSDRVESLF